MLHLLNLSREVRALIYDFYLEGLEYYVDAIAPFKLNPEKRPRGSKFSQGTIPNVLSLTRVNRQVYMELGPKVASSTLLVFGLEYVGHYADSIKSIPKDFLQQIWRADMSRYFMGWRDPESSEVILALPSLRAVTCRDLTTGPQFLEPNLPQHEESWNDSTLRSIVDLIGLPVSMQRLQEEVQKLLRKFWEFPCPSPDIREVSIGICVHVSSNKPLWVSVSFKYSEKPSKANSSSMYAHPRTQKET